VVARRELHRSGPTGNGDDDCGGVRVSRPQEETRAGPRRPWWWNGKGGVRIRVVVFLHIMAF